VCTVCKWSTEEVYVCTVSEWSTEEVCLWLRELDLDEHSEAFKTHDIQGRELLTLARDDLKVSTLLCSDLPYLTLPYLTLRGRCVTA